APDLVDWLLEQIAEDEAEARRWQQNIEDDHYDGLERIDLGWKPDRVLAECEAKRRLVEFARDLYQLDPSDHPLIRTNRQAMYILRLLALPHADRPGYREEWKL